MEMVTESSCISNKSTGFLERMFIILLNLFLLIPDKTNIETRLRFVFSVPAAAGCFGVCGSPLRRSEDTGQIGWTFNYAVVEKCVS